MLCFHTSLQALDSFLPETAAELCHLVHTHVTGCGALGEEPRWFAAVQLMEIAGACMVRGGGAWWGSKARWLGCCAGHVP